MDPIALYIVYPFCMGMLGYALQHGLCSWKGKMFCKLLPGLAFLAGLVGCAIPFLVDPYSDQLLTVVMLFILGIGLLGLLLGCIAAWVHYAIVRNKQKKEK